MRSVKIITRTTVASTVAFHSSTALVLSQLKEFARLGDDRLFATRRFWAKELLVDRRTLQRWEDEIINSSPKLAYLFYDGKSRVGKQGLDFYQRFFFALIRALKEGMVKEGMSEKESVTYHDIIKWFLDLPESGEPRWMGLNRKEFQKWNEMHNQRRAS